MSRYTDFVAMTEVDAADYLLGFLDEMDSCLDRFRSAIQVDLTFAPESLTSVWNAVLPNIGWRPGWNPPPDGRRGTLIPEAAIESADLLPSWFHHPSGVGYARFSIQTLWLIDGLGRYLGEILVRSGLGQWKAGASTLEGYNFQNQPVVVGATTDPVSPIQSCAVLVSRALGRSAGRGPGSPGDLYKAWGIGR